jgi:hypothetical protein
MSNFPALEVVIGLTFVYFVLSLICSAVTESIASRRGWRAAKLEDGVKNLLSGSSAISPEGTALAKDVYDHPLIQALIAPVTGKQAAAGKKPWPSYIPSRTFVTALLDVAAAHSDKAAPGDASSPPAPEDGSPPHASAVDAEVAGAIAALPSPELRRALQVLYKDAEGDAERFRRSAEQWFDDSMQRVSGWYRRHIQVALWVIGIVVVILLNVDTLQVADTLWKDPAARSAVVAQADAAAKKGQGADATSALSKLELPLGWKLFKAGSGPQEFPNRAGGIIAKIVGLLLTVAALSLGAPFWYDLLGKFVRVSGTGPRPPTADQRAAASQG